MLVIPRHGGGQGGIIAVLLLLLLLFRVSFRYGYFRSVSSRRFRLFYFCLFNVTHDFVFV